MVEHELLQADGILVIRPAGSLEASDFQKIAQDVDPYIEANGKLHGVMIDAKSFPGWKDFAAFVAHLRFVKDHHRKIEKVAAVMTTAISASFAAISAAPLDEYSEFPVDLVGCAGPVSATSITFK